MKKYLIALGVVSLAILVLAGGGFLYANYLKGQPSLDKDMKEVTLGHEDVVNITKPSVVRLMQHIKGKADIPDAKIDFDKFEVIPNPSGPRKKVDVDEYLAGSGFVVNSDGYIITNSHVVSYQTIKNALAALQLLEVLDREMDRYVQLGKGEPGAKLNSLKAEEMGTQLGRKMIEYFVKEGKFELEKKVVVLNPSADTSDKEKMFNEGFPASMVSVNDNYFADSRDAALVKIDQNRLPALKLGSSSGINVGNKVTIFGFPASAEFNGKSFLESTFTDGTINSIKDSDNKDFKIFQSDAKISEGSSGGPMLDELGRVIGLITYESSSDQRDSGDNFAFALPITDASSWIDSSVVNFSLKPAVLNDGAYSSHVLAGLKFLGADRCQKAISEFTLAKDMNPNFSTDKYMQAYIDKCDSIIKSGKSINTRWDEKKQDLAKINKTTWFIVSGGVLLLIAAVFIIIFLVSRLKKDEQEMHVLENRIGSSQNFQENIPEPQAQSPVPSPEVFPKVPDKVSEPVASKEPAKEIKPVLPEKVPSQKNPDASDAEGTITFK